MILSNLINKWKNAGKKAHKTSCQNQICSNCKTGKESYELDSNSEACPYIGCRVDGKCPFYTSLK